MMQSADKVCYFYEDGVIGPKGELLVPAEVSLNKVGHALAEKIPAFHRATFNDRVREVCYKLDLKAPAVVQSMYMYKNPNTGSEGEAGNLNFSGSEGVARTLGPATHHQVDLAGTYT